MSQTTNIAGRVSSPAMAAPDIRDIKSPVDIPNGWEWLWWVLLALGVVAVAILLWRWWQWKKRETHIEIKIPPHERARRKLQEALDYFDRPKVFCILVSDAVRLYLEERFGLRAPERTTEEFLSDLSHSVVLTDPQKTSIQEFLTACDMVKFAKYEPQRLELESLYNSALHLIEETEPKEMKTENENQPPGELVNRES